MSGLLSEPWVSFFGRFHPVLVHLPIGALLVVAVLELAGVQPRLRGVRAANGLILGLAALASIGAAAAGYCLSLGGGYNAALVSWHMWSGFAVAGGCVLAFALYALRWRGLYYLSLVATVGVLFIASHYGGTLTHGAGFFTERMPAPLRQFVGLGPPAGAGQPVENPMQVQAYDRLVEPVFNRYCVDCHGASKSKGDLRLDSFEHLKAGSENGAVFEPGHPSQSKMIEYMLAPLGADEHMPPEGNPQPKEADIALVSWWIQNGANPDATVGEMTLPEQIAGILASRFDAAGEASMRPVDELRPVMARLRDELGLVIRPIAQKQDGLRVSARNVTHQFGDQALQRLAPLAANIRWLNLAGTQVTDAGLKVIAQMKNLQRLHLEKTAVTDAGLKHLRGLWKLEYLNLHSTAISDGGLAHLKQLPRLDQVYLWNTDVTARAARQLQAAFDNPTQIKQWQQKIASLQQQIQQMRRQIRTQGLRVQLGGSAPTAKPETSPEAGPAGALTLGGEKFALQPVNATCPIQDEPATAKNTVIHKGRVVGFCCDQCPTKYQQNPGQYVTSVEGFHKLRGRYVRIDLPGEARPLHLAEVEVVSDGENIAPQGEASQSSTDYDAPAKRAIDGNTNGDWDAGSVTHTKEAPPRWWQVDLGEARVIEAIRIHNRTDEDWHTRLDGYRLTILNDDKQVIYTRTFAQAPEAAQTVSLTKQ